ncbi:MAG: lysylphosphatidylglycerol synthase transmembrane domain-containing protein, partial [Dehalococcoidia bacterium]|nr:lysylphosphatidylglycerol synthase transmembrane domain-containing protein [Dehalococcoidia bacterium]
MFLRILVSLVGLGIVAWVLRGIDLAETGEALLGARLPYLGLGLLLVATSLFVRTLRWKYMLSPRKSIRLSVLVGPLAIGYAIGNVTATGIGAIPRSLLITRKEGLPTSYVLGTVLIEFVIDAAVVVSWAAIVAFFVELPPVLTPLPYLLALLAICIYLIILAFKRRRSFLIKILPLMRLAPLVARLPQEVGQGWAGFQEGASAFLNHPPTLMRVGILTILVWVVESLLFWVLMLAVGIGASLPQGSVVMAFTHVVIGIPSLPGFVGTLDAA